MHEITTLANMLAYRRPHGSESERRFILRFIEPLGMTQDGAGNLIKRIGDSPVLFSSHTDSVHRKPGMQQLSIGHDVICLPKNTDSNCLGADCATGVWLMREMIRYQIPGLYVFHRAEEHGGKGSDYIARHRPEFLDGLNAAIAFDRRGANSIITHQGWGRCCSDTFADSLAAEIKLGHSKDDSGVFTDTANYVDLIGECTNISVGYVNEHQKTEAQDTAYLMELRESMLTFDHTKLDYSRQPGEQDNTYGRYVSFSPVGNEEREHTGALVYGSRDHRLMRELVSRNTEEIIDLLTDYGIDANDLAQYVFDRGGEVPHEMFSQNAEI